MEDRIFPVFKMPGMLKVLDVRQYSWHEQLTVACAQGLINRVEPRVYLVFDDHVDRLWLDLQRYGVKHEEVNDLYELISSSRNEILGFMVYDAVETALCLVQAALNIKGVYVNNIERSIKDFLREYGESPDSQIVETAFELWRNRDKAKNGLDETRSLIRRIIAFEVSWQGD